jgi:uncharacterized repeat protein (TIGR01451 family)
LARPTRCQPRLEALEDRTLLNATDLAVTLTIVGPLPSYDPTPGALLTYTLTVRNNGPDATSASPTVTHTLPTSLHLVAARSDRGTVTVLGDQITATPGILANGASATITIDGMPAAPGTLSPSASVAPAAGDTDPVSTNNTSGPAPIAVASPDSRLFGDAAVILNQVPATAAVGQTITFTAGGIALGNKQAPADLIVRLPEGLTFVAVPQDLQLVNQPVVKQTGSVVAVSLGPLNPSGATTVPIVVRATAVGPQSIFATVTVYNGGADSDVTNNASSATVTAYQGLTDTTLAVPAEAPASGQPVTLTARVAASQGTPGTPIGYVSFYDGPALYLGVARLDSNGVATMTLSRGLSAGSHSLHATFQNALYPDEIRYAFAPSDSPAVSLTVRAATATALTSGTAATAAGQPVTFTATVAASDGTPGAPTGTVTFWDGRQTLDTVPLDASGHASLTTALLPAGRSTVTAVYGGDTTFAGSTSAALAQAVPTGSGNPGFVTQLYLDLLGRAPDADGAQGWVSALDTNALTRTQAAFLIEQSTEYRVRQLDHLYESLLGRTVDPVGRDGWLGFLGQGGTFAQVEAAILGSLEYSQAHGGNDVSGFLNAVYADVLGRTVDATGLVLFSAELKLGTDRLTVAQQILASQESDMREVTALYNQLLRRDPDAAGSATLLSLLQSGTANEVAMSLILGSSEYFERFTS